MRKRGTEMPIANQTGKNVRPKYKEKRGEKKNQVNVLLLHTHIRTNLVLHREEEPSRY